MATKKTRVQKSKVKKVRKPYNTQQIQTVFGVFLLVSGVFLMASFISFFYTWQHDQSILTDFADKNTQAFNHLGKVGAQISYFLVYEGCGLAAFLVPLMLFVIGGGVLFKIPSKKIFNTINWWLVGMVWIAITIAFFNVKKVVYAGVVGYELNLYLQVFLGKIGLGLLLVFGYMIYIVVRFKLSPGQLNLKFSRFKKNVVAVNAENKIEEENLDKVNLVKNPGVLLSVDQSVLPTIKNHSAIISSTEETEMSKPPNGNKGIQIELNAAEEEEVLGENISDKLVSNFGEFDPTLDLSNFKFPPLNLLTEFNETISVDEEELESNKNKIVESLRSYKIEIAQIKATVGPTVTLYEIVPEAGIRVSKIKNLEDDIALSLSALGIRIIAPIPGKGTIGIEVPNSRLTMVSMRSVLSSSKFQEANMELPVALGKTISNETFVFDLAKMPHLLMAGATGQGKSVGLNAVLTSLLYKKHPAEIKLVLVDPKKVELTLFNKIERHYLAKLPDTDEAIITDTKKVVNTLNSLCLEMDERYDLLKQAMVRNIKEYNIKFKSRKLNPDNGHKFLPYIILVIDEFADLIMTAGKEVEMPIARLAQLARAIGIHLIVATQRPSVNVITGLIKANFPARIAFRVTSKIDSRTILDASGADQLIGKGDLLYSAGSDILRIQCAFVDTPEVEKITDFIGGQRAYPEAYLLPEYEGEENGTNIDISIDERDLLFEEAATLVVTTQQGSTSLIQRKLKLGYNRAGRIIDQLEAAGIIGPFEGSKARQVLVSDIIALEQFFESEKS